MADLAKAKKLLEEAMRHLPTANAYSNTKIHIKRALSEMVHAHQKHARPVVAESPNWQLFPETGQVLPPAEIKRRTQTAWNILNGMFAEEEKKLADLDKKTRHDEDTDDNNVGPLFG